MPTAHRIVLAAAELAVLAAKCGVELPPAFLEDEPSQPAGAESDEWEAESARPGVGLRRRGLLDGDGAPIASVATSLAVLAGAQVRVRTDVAVGDDQRRWLHTLMDGLGASLLRPGGGEVELSLFPAWEFTAELSRTVPGLPGAASD
jgi:hypothetical protein